MVMFSLAFGELTIELYSDKAPVTVENFLAYVDAGFYEGTIFHRIVPGFVIQGGGRPGLGGGRSPLSPSDLWDTMAPYSSAGE